MKLGMWAYQFFEGHSKVIWGSFKGQIRKVCWIYMKLGMWSYLLYKITNWLSNTIPKVGETRGSRTSVFLKYEC